MNRIRKRVVAMLPLLLITLLCVASIYSVDQLTKEKIQENSQLATLAVINDVVTVKHDNDIFNDHIEISVPAYINPTERIMVYRIRYNNKVVGVSLISAISSGYVAPISLLIGIKYDGTLMGVRILEQNETAGFGDQAHQDNSGWLLQFKQQNIEKVARQDWAIKKDGGQFDQLSGATITSRSITNILYRTLDYYTRNRDLFYADN